MGTRSSMSSVPTYKASHFSLVHRTGTSGLIVCTEMVIPIFDYSGHNNTHPYGSSFEPHTASRPKDCAAAGWRGQQPREKIVVVGTPSDIIYSMTVV